MARRPWLKLAAIGTALAAIGGSWLAGRRGTTANPAQAERQMVERLVDILVPADETPGALALGVHERLLADMLASPVLAQAWGELFRVLDREARRRHGRDFLALALAQQDVLMQALMSAGTAAEGQPGLVQLRDQTLQLYFAQPQTWPALGLSGPPQPMGFMDYTQAPQPRT